MGSGTGWISFNNSSPLDLQPECVVGYDNYGQWIQLNVFATIVVSDY